MHNVAEANTAFPRSAQDTSSSQRSGSSLSEGSKVLGDGFNRVVSSAQNTFEAHIRSEPFRSVAIGFGVGFVLAKILGGGCDDCDDCDDC